MLYDVAQLLFFATTYAVVVGRSDPGTGTPNSFSSSPTPATVSRVSYSSRAVTKPASTGGSSSLSSFWRGADDPPTPAPTSAETENPSSSGSHEGSESRVVYYDNPFEGPFGSGNPFGSLSARPTVPYPHAGDTATDTALRWPAPNPPGSRNMNKTRVYDIDAECQNDYMKIAITFNGSFSGLIYTTSYANDPGCVYVNGSGSYRYDFYIRLNRCGTLNGGAKGLSDDKKYMWNTLTVQYNPLIEEEWDEHFKVTCEYGYDFWKTVSFPVVDVHRQMQYEADSQIATGNPLLFTLNPPECYMEIRQGFGLTGARIAGPVSVGDPLTLIIYMRSQTTGFDVIINNCVAHNGGQKKMFLIDKHGCPVDEKLVSEFRGKDFHGGVYETQVFAYFKAFRFTGSPALYIECDVRMCHGICPKQRCYWRSLQKRSIADNDRNDSASVSDTLKMFQSIDVRTEKSDTASSQVQNPTNDPGAICLRPGGFVAILSLLLLLLLVVTGVSCVLCLRMRRLRGGQGSKDIKYSSYPSTDFTSRPKTRMFPQPSKRESTVPTISSHYK